MFEKTKLIMTFVFTLCFLSYSFLIGRFYEKFQMSRTVWIVICAITTAGVIASFVADLISDRRLRNESRPK